MTSFQFYHGSRTGIKKDFTVAVDAPTSKDIEELLKFPVKSNRKIKIKVGVSYCNPIDNFCKKTGRDIAIARMKELEYEVFQVRYYEDELSVILENNDFLYALCFSIKDGRDVARLMMATYDYSE